MPRQQGDTIYLYKGETLTLSVAVYDNAGVLATNLLSAKFVLYKESDGVVSIRSSSISSSNVICTLTEAETLLLDGSYRYEVRVKTTDSDIDSLIIGNLIVESAPITTAM